jgi:hypothetical protein
VSQDWQPRSPDLFTSLASTTKRRRFPAALRRVQCLAEAEPGSTPTPPPALRWHAALATAAGLYPAYVTAGASAAVARPEAFRRFADVAPGSYTATLGFIMLAMGLTLKLRDFAALLRGRPLSPYVTGADSSSLPCFLCICSMPELPILCILDPSLLSQILFGCAAQYTIMPIFAPRRYC